MTDRIRDRTLVMRVLPPSLQSRLREKMRIAEDRAHRQHLHTSSQLLEDLDGVTIFPAEDGSTLFYLRCDDQIYPGSFFSYQLFSLENTMLNLSKNVSYIMYGAHSLFW